MCRYLPGSNVAKMRYQRATVFRPTRDIMPCDYFATFEHTLHQIASFIEQLVGFPVGESIRKDEIPVLLIRFDMLWRQAFEALVLTTQTNHTDENGLIAFF